MIFVSISDSVCASPKCPVVHSIFSPVEKMGFGHLELSKLTRERDHSLRLCFLPGLRGEEPSPRASRKCRAQNEALRF